MRNQRLVYFFAVALLVVAAVGLFASGAAADSSRNFVAHLSQERPDTESQGQGQAIFHFSKDGTELTFRLNVANIEDVTQAHIHIADTPGAVGPVVLWLYPAGPPPQEIPGRSDGVLGTGTVTATSLVGPLDDDTTFDNLLQAIEEGRAYVNVHTTAVPSGEIAGTIE